MAKMPSPFNLPLSRKWQENGHSGVDWAKAGGAALGATIRASGPGIVSFSGLNNSRSGHVTTATYDNGVMALYCHRQATGAPGKGTRITEGSPLGLVGYTGNVIPAGVNGAHLHLEVYVSGRLVNPGDYFDFTRLVGNGDTGQVAGFNAHDAWVQTSLNQLGCLLEVDGIRGTKTIAAVKDLQSKHGLEVDGIPGPRTTELIRQLLAPAARPILRRGATGTEVGLLQRTLKANYPLYASRLVADEVFGPATEGVVREFQRRAGLVVDGIVGAQTWKALGL